MHSSKSNFNIGCLEWCGSRCSYSSSPHEHTNSSCSCSPPFVNQHEKILPQAISSSYNPCEDCPCHKSWPLFQNIGFVNFQKILPWVLTFTNVWCWFPMALLEPSFFKKVQAPRILYLNEFFQQLKSMSKQTLIF
jgi:hypothetical protein